MSIHLTREIDALKKALLTLCGVVEEQVYLSVQSIRDRDPDLARRVEDRDDEIDQREVEIEENCLKILALHQPVAIDLRLIVSVLKINNDLERVGDLAVNISHAAIALAKEPRLGPRFDLSEMASKSQAMLRDALDAFVNMDTQLAVDVCARDDEVDQMKRHFRIEVAKTILEDSNLTKGLLRIQQVSRNLERIADCATNIAEDVIYMIEGKIVRHGESD